jgi:hypothetical protein
MLKIPFPRIIFIGFGNAVIILTFENYEIMKYSTEKRKSSGVGVDHFRANLLYCKILKH